MAKEKTPLKWKSKVGKNIWSCLSISEGLLYFGGNNEYLYSLDINTGQEKGQFKPEDPSWFSPTVLDGVAYFGGYDKHLHAVEIKTGKKIWKFWADYGAESSPLLGGGVVYFGTNDKHLYAKTGDDFITLSSAIEKLDEEWAE